MSNKNKKYKPIEEDKKLFKERIDELIQNINNHSFMLGMLQANLQIAQSLCDHKDDDGSSSIRTMHTADGEYNYCIICKEKS
jgi:hypothetical protein